MSMRSRFGFPEGHSGDDDVGIDKARTNCERTLRQSIPHGQQLSTSMGSLVRDAAMPARGCGGEMVAVADLAEIEPLMHG